MIHFVFLVGLISLIILLIFLFEIFHESGFLNLSSPRVNEHYRRKQEEMKEREEKQGMETEVEEEVKEEVEVKNEVSSLEEDDEEEIQRSRECQEEQDYKTMKTVVSKMREKNLFDKIRHFFKGVKKSKQQKEPSSYEIGNLIYRPSEPASKYLRNHPHYERFPLSRNVRNGKWIDVVQIERLKALRFMELRLFSICSKTTILNPQRDDRDILYSILTSEQNIKDLIYELFTLLYNNTTLKLIRCQTAAINDKDVFERILSDTYTMILPILNHGESIMRALDKMKKTTHISDLTPYHITQLHSLIDELERNVLAMNERALIIN